MTEKGGREGIGKLKMIWIAMQKNAQDRVVWPDIVGGLC